MIEKKIYRDKLIDFINKEIKGFEYEDNSFYIVKPNEFKLWHEAIAYYDLAEFENNKLKTTPQKWGGLINSKTNDNLNYHWEFFEYLL